MKKKIEIKKGDKYGKLTVLKEDIPYFTSKKFFRKMLCKCECGKEISVVLSKLKNNHTKSCGCLRKENKGRVFTHRKTHFKIYKTWSRIIQRCTNPKNNSYKYYGGKRIRVCDRWLNSFEDFLKDMGECPEGKILGRIDVNDNYSLNNCEWTTSKKQSERRRQMKGKTHYHWFKDRTKLKKRGCREGGRDPFYMELCKQTRERDNKKCKINNKDCNGQLEVHHILDWINYPELRYDIKNLITLCQFHHPHGRKNEAKMSPYLKELISKIPC